MSNLRTIKQQVAKDILDAIENVYQKSTDTYKDDDLKLRKYQNGVTLFTRALQDRCRKTVGIYRRSRDLKKNDRVEHNKLGKGIVISTSGEVAEINFDKWGVRQIVLLWGLPCLRKIRRGKNAENENATAPEPTAPVS